MRKLIDCDIHGESIEFAEGGQMCLECLGDKLREEHLTKLYQDELLSRKQKSLLPIRYIDASFDNYIPSNKKSASLLDFCKDYQFNKDILLLGTTGVGKTHLGCALLAKALDMGKSGMYFKFYQLADLKIKNYELFKQILTCDFVIIDEFGQQESDFKHNLLFEVIDQRYDNKVVTVLISNHDKESFAKSMSHQLFSRLTQNSAFIHCDWEDYRLKSI